MYCVRLYLVIELAPEAFGFTDPIVNGYVKKGGNVKLVYRFSEVAVLMEVFNHVAGIQTMKRHIFIFAVWSLFIAFAVIPFYNSVSHFTCCFSSGLTSCQY